MEIKKVMLIDDDPDILKIGKLSLTGIGNWEVFTASSGNEAIQVAARETPDVILLDTAMPDMDGVAVLQQLRQAPALTNVPIFLTTTRVTQGEDEYYRSRGASGIMSKPFNPITLPAEIESRLTPRS
ncbi:MAG: response regulator [Candidatus Obscuribacterales bacterium]|nr:response regulator [Candidatus Obscuribacterales bacterium]